jgi:hypothetical protein
VTPDLRDHIGDIARRLLGAPNKGLSTRSQLRFGTNGSVAVELKDKKAGTWFDHEAGVGDSPRKMLRVKGGLADGEISAWLRREFGISPEISMDRYECGSAQHVLKTYYYRDENGEPLFRVLRWEPSKTFTQEASSAHKAQSSEWSRVLVCDQSLFFRDERWRWLYTALTRSADAVVVPQ